MMITPGLQVCSIVVLAFAFAMFPVTGDFPQAEANSPHFVTVEVITETVGSLPQGEFHIVAYIQKLMSDGNSQYDWYFYDVRLQTVPGWQTLNNAWATDHTWARHYVVTPGTTRWLSDYDPTTTAGQTTVAVSISGGGASLMWSYTVSDVTVLDNSCFGNHWARWEHCINERADVGRFTYLAKPGFVVRTLEGSWSLIDGWYKVRWERWFWDHHIHDHPNAIWLDAFKPGVSLKSLRLCGDLLILGVPHKNRNIFAGHYNIVKVVTK